MSNDKFIAWVQAILSAIYLLFTFVIIIIYELGLADMSAEQDKSFQTQINWLTGGGLIILYFWFQRAKANNQPDPGQTTTTQTTQTVTTPTDPGAPVLVVPPVPTVVETAKPGSGVVGSEPLEKPVGG